MYLSTPEVSHSRRGLTLKCHRDERETVTAKLPSAAAVGCTDFVRLGYHTATVHSPDTTLHTPLEYCSLNRHPEPNSLP